MVALVEIKPQLVRDVATSFELSVELVDLALVILGRRPGITRPGIYVSLAKLRDPVIFALFPVI